VNLAPTPEQEDFRRSLRRFADDHFDAKSVRRWMAGDMGFDPVLWRKMGAELGLQAIWIPEAYGGHGFGFVELGIALEELGRRLAGGPFLASAVLGAGAILNAGCEERKRALLPGIASGETIACLAVSEPDGCWEPGALATEARAADGGWRLDGVKSFVLDGHVADLVVVAARLPGTGGEEGIALFTVPGDAPGLSRTLLPSLDETRKQARLALDGVQAEPLGEPGRDGPALVKTLDQAAIALACEMVGAAQLVLDVSVEYAKTRVQFGRPIGSFQAIKHKCAEMLLSVETARSAATYAARTAALDSGEVPIVASLAKAHCAEAFFHCAAECLQIHGGIAFTWEHDAHLYLKRAKSSDLLLGDATFHRERLARRIVL
jgi:alkylation response protein AidB-like acyl-CoA dehydrogenase